MKKRLVLPILGILILAGVSLFFDFKYKSFYGDRYKVLNPTMMYWYPKNSVDNVSYYLFEKGDNLYCKYESTNQEFYMCAWKFDPFRDPLFGWVKIKDLERR